MGNILWFDSAGIVPCVPTASSAQADSPSSRMGVIGGRFERPWRSTDLSAQSLAFPFAGSTSIVGFALYNFNAPSITIAGTPYTVSQDFDDMGKLFKIVPLTTASVAVSIPGSQTTFDSANFYKIGRLYFLTGVHEMEQCPETISREIRDPQIIAPRFGGGVLDTLPAGTQFSVEQWGGRWMSDELPNVKTLFKRRAHQWVGYFRNYLDRDYEFWFAGKSSGLRIDYSGNLAVQMAISFEQKN